MASVRTRKQTNTLFLDFYYQGVRCREQTALENTPENVKLVSTIAKRLDARILLGELDYEEFFPGSSNAIKFADKKSSTESLTDEPNEPNAVTESTAKTFKQYTDVWFLHKKVEWRHSHAKNIRSILNSSLIKYFGAKEIKNISKLELLEFRSFLSEKKGRGNERVSNKTINNHMQLLRTILTEAADELQFVNPYRDIKPLKIQKSHVMPFSLQEVELIIRSVRKDYRNYYICRFYTGLRSGEINGLQWKYVDFERRQILIRETIVDGRREYTKTDGSQREVQMIGPVYEALKAQHSATFGLSEYVFCNLEGQPLDHNNVCTRVWYPLLRNLGLDKRRQYQTRHTAATLMLACGENAEWVAKLLGHSTTEMLFKVYSRYIPNATHNDGSQFEKLLNANNQGNNHETR